MAARAAVALSVNHPFFGILALDLRDYTLRMNV
jgi:hypothetical protein